MPRFAPLPVDTFMRTDGQSARARAFTRELQDEHNVNLHASADDCDALLDAQTDEFDGLTVVDELEFFERFVL